VFNKNWLNITTVIRSRRMRWAGHATFMGNMINAYIILLTKKTKGKRPLGRPV
jgi:hypothetical protein